MDVAAVLRQARTSAGLSQRELASRTGIAQPTIARIEAGHVDPRVRTLDRLLSACGVELATVSRSGSGIDRTQIRELLRLTPLERLELLRLDAAGLRRLEAARR